LVGRRARAAVHLDAADARGLAGPRARVRGAGVPQSADRAADVPSGAGERVRDAARLSRLRDRQRRAPGDAYLGHAAGRRARDRPDRARRPVRDRPPAPPRARTAPVARRAAGLDAAVRIRRDHRPGHRRQQREDPGALPRLHRGRDARPDGPRLPSPAPARLAGSPGTRRRAAALALRHRATAPYRRTGLVGRLRGPAQGGRQRAGAAQRRGDRRHGRDGGRRIARDRRGPSVRRRGPSRDEIPGARVLARRVTMIALLQRGLRALFMGAEALFNRAFGDRLNPLYHLGAITFFLFWIVAVTGIALYVFFDTSVHGAYAS